MMAGRAVIVGAGAIGIASAHFLRESGWDVTVLDRGAVGEGASRANSSLIVPSHTRPVPGPGIVAQGLRHLLRRDSPFSIRPRADPGLARWLWAFRRSCTREAAEAGFRAMAGLGRESLRLFGELVRSGAVSYGFEQRGLLHVYLSAPAMGRARTEAEELEVAGFRARVLSADEVHALEPGVGRAVLGGLLIEDQAHGECFDYVRSLADGLERAGVRISTGQPVERIVRANGRVGGVVAGGECVDADVVVLAAGAWTPSLARPLGIHVPLQPAKGYSCTVDRFERAPSIPIISDERRVAITPLGDRIRFGGTLELTGFDEGVNPTRYGALISSAREILGSTFELRNEAAWSGFRPLACDGLPIIGPAPKVDGLLLATGHGMLGYTLSPVTGKLIAELATGQPPSVPIGAFRPDRFGR